MGRRGAMAALALAGILAACTSGTGPESTPSPPSVSASAVSPTATSASTPTAAAVPGGPDGLEVLDTGDEPRTDLAATATLDGVMAVSATSTSTLDLGGDAETTTATADYGLDVVLETSDDATLLVATTTDLTTDAVPEVPDPLGRFEWTLTPSGQVTSMAAPGWPDPVDPELATLLSFSHLVLEVPTIPVGAGARWQREVDGADVVVTLDGIDEDELRATIEVRSTPAGGELAVTSDGTWERDTLVALDVTTTSAATASREVVAEGEPTTARVDQVDERHLLREEGP